jgi:ribulose-phosphate 3-epimerase
MKAGVAIKPDTPADVVYPLLDGDIEKPDVRRFLSLIPGWMVLTLDTRWCW